MSKPFMVAAWAEDFSGIYEFDSLEAADGFAHGWSEGAGQYGAGRTTTYVLPRDQAELDAKPKDLKEVQAELERMAQQKRQP